MQVSISKAESMAGEKAGIMKFTLKTGYSSDPVVMIKDAVEKYGGRKPIMISECGSAYRTNGDINETDSEWAAKYLKTNIYIHSYGISSSKSL